MVRHLLSSVEVPMVRLTTILFLMPRMMNIILMIRMTMIEDNYDHLFNPNPPLVYKDDDEFYLNNNDDKDLFHLDPPFLYQDNEDEYNPKFNPNSLPCTNY